MLEAQPDFSITMRCDTCQREHKYVYGDFAVDMDCFHAKVYVVAECPSCHKELRAQIVPKNY